MKNFFERLITVDVSDPEDARKRRLLNILLLGVFIALFLNLFSLLDPKNRELILMLAGVMLMAFIGIIAIYFINRRSGKWATTLFLLLLTLVVNLSDTPFELSNGRSIFVYTFPIIISSLLMFPSAGFIFAALSSASMTVLAFSVSNTPNSLAIIGFFMLALVSWLVTRSLELSIRDLRIINTNLDNIVVERTRELSDALSRERIESGRNQAILNSIADGVIVFDSNNNSILANPALSRLTNTVLQGLIGIDANKFINVDQISQSDREMMMEFISHPEKNTSALRIDWGKNTFSTSIAPVQTSDHENIGTVIVFRDITQETQLERMKDNFVAIISHELRTPLNAIMGHAEIMKEAVYGPLNEKQLSITERIMVNVTRLLGMVGDLLDEAQIRAGKLSIKPQIFKVSSLLENLHGSMDKMVTDKGLSLVGKIGDGIPPQIAGDPQRIQQILFNLVGNAIKFTEQGSIEVNIDRTDADYWKLEVSDHGIGIPENELPYIFDTFRQASNEVSTRQHGGFGLGLSIVKQLVELMGGNVHVKSESEKGSTFTVSLPLKTSL